MYIYIYTDRERDVYIYIYTHICIYTKTQHIYIYIYIHTCACVILYRYIYIYIYTYTAVREKNTSFAQALALQPGSRNCPPALDSELFELISPGVFFSGGVFISQTPVRPISLLTLSLLTLLDSNFPGKSLGNPYGPGNSTH